MGGTTQYVQARLGALLLLRGRLVGPCRCAEVAGSPRQPRRDEQLPQQHLLEQKEAAHKLLLREGKGG